MHVAEISVDTGYDQAGLVAAVLARAEALAREADYRFLRAAPADKSDQGLAPYRAAGLELLDYYLWAYRGTVDGVPLPEQIKLRPLMSASALERRLHYLRLELAASNVAGRELIEAALLPRRPPRQAFEIVSEGRPVGFLAPRPNERGDGVLTLVLSLLPELWGTKLEQEIVAGYAGLVSRGEPQPLRVLLSTTSHCEAADHLLARLGLERQLDDRPVLYKPLG